MKGIILAAGKGTRLYPITLPVCKPLLPVYDKPLIYYSLATLMEARIRDVLIIVPFGETEAFYNLLGDGSLLGITIQYKEQVLRKGIADAFLLGREFIENDNVCLILGDNIFFGPYFRSIVRDAVNGFTDGAKVFGYYVNDPRPFGVVEFNKEGLAVSIEEKPLNPKSNYIIPGLYIYDNNVISIAEQIIPSERGELEITSVNNIYLKKGMLRVVTLDKNYSWFDAGTADSLYEAAGSIKAVQMGGKLIGCLEEVAYLNHWITLDEIKQSVKKYKTSQYGQYLSDLINDLSE